MMRSSTIGCRRLATALCVMCRKPCNQASYAVPCRAPCDECRAVRRVVQWFLLTNLKEESRGGVPWSRMKIRIPRGRSRDFRDYAKAEVPEASARSYLLSLPPLPFSPFFFSSLPSLLPKDKFKSALTTRENLYCRSKQSSCSQATY